MVFGGDPVTTDVELSRLRSFFRYLRVWRRADISSFLLRIR
jgi:hypothetical protein